MMREEKDEWMNENEKWRIEKNLTVGVCGWITN